MKWKTVLYKISLILSLLFSKISFSQVPADSTAADSALLKQVEQQMQGNSTGTIEQPQQNRSGLHSIPISAL